MLRSLVGRVQHGRLSRQADALELRGDGEGAVALGAKAVRSLERALGPHHPDVTAAQAALARRCGRQRQWARAGLLVDQVVAAWRDRLDEGSGEASSLVLGLAAAYAAESRDPAAERVIETLLDAPPSLLSPRPGVDGEGWGDRFVEMGARLHDQGRPRLALRFLMRGSALLEEEGAPPNALHRVWDELAVIHDQLREHASAEQLIRRALVVALRPGAPADPQKLIDLYRRLAEACQKQHKFSDMEDAYRRAIAVSDETWGLESQKVVPLLWPLGGFYRRSGRFDEAEVLYRRIYQNTQPRPPLDVVDRLASIYEAEGRWHEAEILLRYLNVTYERERAPDEPRPPEQAPTLARLAISIARQGRDAEAAPMLELSDTLFKTALVRCAREHGPASPQMARLLEVQVLLFRETGRGDQAAEADARLRVIRGVTLRENPA
jgi:tetratricopeptide (TPR) repeat protein